MKKCRQLLCVLLAALLLAGTVPPTLAEPVYATRGQVADMLVAAADDYNSGVQRTDVIKGYGNGDLKEDGAVTRAEALVMLSRAFGKLPTPVGDNARLAYDASNFTDIPDWAKTELANVFQTGIVAGTSATTFSPDQNVTLEQMELFISRVFALEGTNQRDDFYAAVNKTALDASVIPAGRESTGTMSDVETMVNQELTETIKSVSAAPKTDKEKMVATLYANILNKTARNAAGITPVKSYLDAVENAGSLAELMQARKKIYEDFGITALLGFGIETDAKDNSVYDLDFSAFGANLGHDGYTEATASQKSAYLKYIKTVLQLVGKNETDAAAGAQTFWNTESAVADKSLTQQEYYNVDKTYNLFTMAQLQAIFPNVDLSALLAETGLRQTDKIVVKDVGALRAAAAYFDDAHLDELKNETLVSLAAVCGTYLSDAFQDAANTFSSEYYGVSGTLSDEEIAAQRVEGLMSDYIGEAYVSRYFSAASKKDVESMVQSILSTYRERIGALTWMSAETKAGAIKKLDTMKVRIGYPDTWKDDLKGVEIKSVAEGGSYLANAVAIQKRANQLMLEKQAAGPDKTEWTLPAYEVNACYDPSDNSITFPAAILQKPLYDPSASFEKNLGGIGYVIGHEITHAFDNNGAKYDENGNAADWWSEADYAAFQKLCDKVVALYDGREIAPGIVCDGALTVSENIADLGATACVTQIESKRTTPDYKTLYTAIGETWCESFPRAYREYLARVDVHAPDKLRGSLVLQQFQQFYDTFGIKAGDGMWIAPENRVTIW